MATLGHRQFVRRGLGLAIARMLGAIDLGDVEVAAEEAQRAAHFAGMKATVAFLALVRRAKNRAGR